MGRHRPPTDAEIARMRAKSGEVTDTRPLVVFLYRLMRDYVPMSDIEEVMTDCNLDTYDPRVRSFTNGWAAMYAQDIADRLLGTDGTSQEVSVD